MQTASPVYYDPYDFEIDADPYPVCRQLREERPLYYNERYDFFAVSRFEDVERGLVDWRTYSSAKGSVLELIKANMEIPPGSIIFEDPPEPRPPPWPAVPGVHPAARWRPSSRRSGSSAPAASIRSSARAASTSSPTSARRCRCGRSACCSASPRQDQEAMRDQIDEGLRLRGRAPCPRPSSTSRTTRRRPSPSTSTGGPSTRPTTS